MTDGREVPGGLRAARECSTFYIPTPDARTRASRRPTRAVSVASRRLASGQTTRVEAQHAVRSHVRAAALRGEKQGEEGSVIHHGPALTPLRGSRSLDVAPLEPL